MPVRVSVSSHRQWKDLLVFKRHDGHHVWNLPTFKPHEYGFRRIARKPPFFKLRKFSFPPITRNYNIKDGTHFNRDVFIRYNWEKESHLFHSLRETIEEKFPGVRVNGMAHEGNEKLKIYSSDGNEIMKEALKR